MRTTPRNPQRRQFLRALGAGTAAVGAGAALGHVTLSQADSQSEASPRPDATRQYHETDHIRAYYATLRD
ncbi:twin-arginine translocation signal domain-containing protein [Halomonas cerina]|uniref:Cysteine synthase n=1 Tax=Halomonas cerina TaxID=447424 RepID=A0A839V1N3_9GAMM|nr:twin-arginine translocation signal domain-containing protein [Halomonas cerina]MBB3189091.1 cysteine synthase [Halomonas cerina]